MALYCFDTSALMDGWNRHYPPDIIPSLWEKLADLAGVGIVFAPDEVSRELSKKDDALSKWSKKTKGLFVPLDISLQQTVTDILTQFPRLVDTRKNRSIADPFVVGLARIKAAAVVTGEKDSGTPERPKIPNVCSHYNVKCLTMLEFIREQGWQFRL